MPPPSGACRRRADTVRRLRYLAVLACGILLVVVPYASAEPTPPTITTSPVGTSTSGSVAFGFSATDVTTTQFRCTLTGPTSSGPEPCTSPKSYSGLADGSYTFSVQAGDATDAFSTAATESFTVAAPDTTGPTVGPHGDITAAATSAAGAAVAYTPPSASDNVDPSPTVTCAPASGTTFPLGATTVNCTAKDAANNPSTNTTSFKITVSDQSGPTVGPHGDITAAATSAAGAAVAYTPPSASDNVDPSPTVTCAPASGTTFPLGATTVNCTAKDAANNPSTNTTSFKITVSDQSGPTVGPHGDITAAATSAAGAAVAYTPPSASDNVDPSPTVTCAPASGTTFPLGATTVNCTAKDAANNPSTNTTSFKITVSDQSGPTVGPHGDITAAATSAAGAAVAYTPPSASDNVDPSPTVTCAPASGTTFPLGATTVNCTAKDAANNPSTNTTSFKITVSDQTPPVVSVPGPLGVEADGPGGTNVSYVVSAQDFDTPLPPSSIACSPASGSLFSLGTTIVGCTAKDAANNVSQPKTFTVTVVDTTAPGINAPDASFTATSASGLLRSDPPITAYLAKISASDLVSAVTLTTSLPETLPIGDTKLVVTARDSAGNEAQKVVTLTVLAPGKPAPAPDFTPPGAVRRAAARAGDHIVRLTWRLPTDKDVAFVRIERSVVGKSATTTVYRRLGTTFTNDGLSNGATYRFVLVAFDKVGNSSAPVVVSATPKAVLLAAPKPGAQVTAPPLLLWAPLAPARYFNVQLYRGGTKVLSAWPSLARLQLASRWSYDGHAYVLAPGVYTWYVWPGLGARADVRYGALLGKSSFTVGISKKPKKSL